MPMQRSARRSRLLAMLCSRCAAVQGLAMGGEFGAAIVYLSELAPVERRGFLTACLQSTTNIGLVSSSGWRPRGWSVGRTGAGRDHWQCLSAFSRPSCPPALSLLRLTLASRPLPPLPAAHTRPAQLLAVSLVMLLQATLTTDEMNVWGW